MSITDRMRKRFERFRKKKQNEIDDKVIEELELENNQVKEEDFVLNKIKDRKLTVEDYSNQMVQTSYQLDCKKLEYEQVTAYLTDIQLIDQMTEDERDSVQAVAFKIATLSKDREDMRNEGKNLTQLQFRFMQLHEHEIKDGIKHMEEQENYAADIRSDLQKLEEEKVNLKYEEKYYLEKLNNLKMITFSGIFLAVIAAGITGFIYMQYVFDVMFVLLVIVFLLAVVGTLVFVKYRNVNYALAYCRKQQARAVQLINKIKIKWVNNTSTLDYLYSKYNVGSSHELMYLWEQYQVILDNEEKYKRSSRELNHYGDLLVKQLQNIGVHDADIWINQTEALIDSREMVEVTHSLNVRRQKLREEMEYDEDVMELAASAIREHLQKHPEEAGIVQKILSPYKLRV